MNHCKDCKHWFDTSGLEVGRCTAAVCGHPLNHPGSPMKAIRAKDNPQAIIMTVEGFGCTLWEGK